MRTLAITFLMSPFPFTPQTPASSVTSIVFSDKRCPSLPPHHWKGRIWSSSARLLQAHHRELQPTLWVPALAAAASWGLQSTAEPALGYLQLHKLDKSIESLLADFQYLNIFLKFHKQLQHEPEAASATSTLPDHSRLACQRTPSCCWGPIINFFPDMMSPAWGWTLLPSNRSHTPSRKEFTAVCWLNPQQGSLLPRKRALALTDIKDHDDVRFLCTYRAQIFLRKEMSKKQELWRLPQNIWASGSAQDTLCISYGCKRMKFSSSGCRNTRDL